jgi:hypothetical protein
VLTKSVHIAAKAARTGTTMTMALVRAAFSKRRLRKSSYAGQKRMRNGIAVQKPSLKKYRKMQDIQGKILGYSCSIILSFYPFPRILNIFFVVF